MSIALVTGAGGLVGSSSVRFLQDKFDEIIGIDNNSRAKFFGNNASVKENLFKLEKEVKNFRNWDVDVRDYISLTLLFKEYKDIELVIHTAGQPSHDWSKNVVEDYEINAIGTLNLLDLTKQKFPNAVFIFTSTNKVYGDSPNLLPLKELNTRFDLQVNHPFYNGINESISIDGSLHTFFGVSKASADLLTQEYGRQGLKTGVFRCGCITGKAHKGVPLHGFLSYLVKCTVNGEPYTVHGYKGKQVRDNIHANDLAAAFYEFYKSPRPGEVYNIGGGRRNSCSVLEAIELAQEMTKKKLKYNFADECRMGDHRWWITDNKKFTNHFPYWKCEHTLNTIIEEMV